MLKFVRERIWSALPQQVGRRSLMWAALLWGGGLLTVAAWMAWRGAGEGAPLGPKVWVTAAAGVVLAAGLLVPGLGPSLYLNILRVMSIVGFVLSHVMMMAAFYLVVTPLGWGLRLAGKDPMGTAKGHGPAWCDHSRPMTRQRYYRLF